ncbi:aldose 1-epimerase [Natronincola peptidivorans]|uniref:Aldose 1-epimerase n=1 Tax=Natronincola peptidivorans TaxID=426128 RepID=A0A1I0BYM8_9FIRM|nr:aldose epimerase family protein [Natronincola peptidivorans]SET11505.1 aldose 1-epimerase [Natronincola peptidivorans]
MYSISKGFSIEDKEVVLISLKNKNNMEVKLLNYGATIVELLVPDRNGVIENVVLTFDNLQDYMENPPYFGATLGRTSGRIGDGRFYLKGKTYQLKKNFQENHGHGGEKGFSHKVWQYNLAEEKGKTIAKFSYNSRGMEENYPGNLEVEVTYTLTEDNQLSIEYLADTDETTLCNLTNHAYFNLSGNYNRKVTEQQLKINSHKFIELNKNMIPTGRIIDVEDTPMDFRELKLIGQDIEADDPQLLLANGYDHPWLVEKGDNQVEMMDEVSGRKMTISTTYPSIVIYSYNYPNNEKLKYDKIGSKYDGICFEAQYEPDGINHTNLSSAILERGEKYLEKIILAFSTI